MTATNVQKLTFSTVALGLLIGALAVTGSFGAANAGAADVFVPGRVYTVTGGETTLKPTKQMIRKLKRAKVRVMPTGSARGGLRKLEFPITDGRIGVSEGKLVGRIGHQGSGLRFTLEIDFGPRSLAFRNPVVDLGRDRLGFSGADTFSYFRLSEIQDTTPANEADYRYALRLTKRGAKLFRNRLGLNVEKGTTFGIIGVLVSYAGGDEQGGGGIYN